MKPILFNTPMVEAILDERKTQTRRTVKPVPSGTDVQYVYAVDAAHCTGGCDYWIEPPYRRGDILYVRETWGFYKGQPGFYCYKAGNTAALDNELEKDPAHKWRPSIHMPKEAARLFLLVMNVRVERLQEIDGLGAFDEGAVAEAPKGCFEPKKPAEYDGWPDAKKREYVSGIARAGYIAKLEFADRLVKEFARIWDSTIKPAEIDLYGWDANPWVWVFEFERCWKVG